jgi:hypothetical protein
MSGLTGRPLHLSGLTGRPLHLQVDLRDALYIYRFEIIGLAPFTFTGLKL